MTIARRLEALEQRSPDNAITVIIRKLVSVGHLDAEARRITYDGREWLRDEGETESEFKTRAIREARDGHAGFITVVAHPDRCAA